MRWKERGQVRGSQGPARRPEGREEQWMKSADKNKILTHMCANTTVKPTWVLTLKFNVKKGETNALSPGLHCPLYFFGGLPLEHLSPQLPATPVPHVAVVSMGSLQLFAGFICYQTSLHRLPACDP